MTIEKEYIEIELTTSVYNEILNEIKEISNEISANIDLQDMNVPMNEKAEENELFNHYKMVMILKDTEMCIMEYGIDKAYQHLKKVHI